MVGLGAAPHRGADAARSGRLRTAGNRESQHLAGGHIVLLRTSFADGHWCRTTPKIDMAQAEGNSPPGRRPDPSRVERGDKGLRSAARFRICVVVGTRPEAIKLAPVILELGRCPESVQTTVVTVARQREMLAQVLDAFAITPDIDLGLGQERQAHAEFTARALLAMTSCFTDVRPDIVVVQGDNSTVLAASLAAHYLGIPVAHVEAGVRSGSIRHPFPEELNRRLASVVADIHFAPTTRCRDNLIAEGVDAERIHLTGNTIVDAVRRQPRKGFFDNTKLNALPWEKRRVVVATLHRREHPGESVVNACRAMAELVALHVDLHLVFALHLDPRVRDIAIEELAGHPRVDLVEPLNYSDMIELLRRSEFAMTDSAGIQEECATLGRPVLILQKSTDRPEVVAAGFGRVIGTEMRSIVEAGSLLLDDARELARMSEGDNPFGDGSAAARIVQALLRGAPRHAGGPPVPEGPPLLPPMTAVER
jgi:UDP-N-acetylglucosamine 2-epimerase (non-hydrolysing)